MSKSVPSLLHEQTSNPGTREAVSFPKVTEQSSGGSGHTHRSSLPSLPQQVQQSKGRGWDLEPYRPAFTGQGLWQIHLFEP